MKLENLLTEARNQRTIQIDSLSTLEIVTLINQEDQTVPTAVTAILPQIAQAVDWITAALRAGGRLFYIGAGTSGRLGVLDASECPPTYGTPPGQVVALIAGGPSAILQAVEGAEDSLTLAAEDLTKKQFAPPDILVGIAASGRTPYVLGGLKYAKSQGCKTISLACSPGSEIGYAADLSLTVLTGPEVIMGSTRMKAGTAQKLVLNM
ncbi:MAG: N-acetylmuramic acid 6-phosphate etherase, partial [Sporomusaceae bacterium]|nr:N-acetylmuramic acid 6-phosphate etherase [Sporomusaceae bacterium]